MARAWLGLVAAMGIAVGFGCNSVGDLIAANGTGAGAGGGTSSGTASGGGAASGLPCDVQMALTTCVACHTNPPIAGAKGSLVTYADLTGPAPTDPTQTMAQMALTRMQATVKPMPPIPLPAATAAQIKTLSDWIAAKTPMGNCGGDAGAPDTTFQGTPSCASNSFYPTVGGANSCDGSNGMSPGLPCVSCHQNPPASSGCDQGPALTIGGTVFATGKVLDNCEPTSAQIVDLGAASLVITDKNGAVHTYPVDKYSGNFSSRHDPVAVAFPYTAKVVYMGKERPMLTPQTNGDCNLCHTASGTSIGGAAAPPGRIALPQ